MKSCQRCFLFLRIFNDNNKSGIFQSTKKVFVKYANHNLGAFEKLLSIRHKKTEKQ